MEIRTIGPGTCDGRSARHASTPVAMHAIAALATTQDPFATVCLRRSPAAVLFHIDRQNRIFTPNLAMRPSMLLEMRPNVGPTVVTWLSAAFSLSTLYSSAIGSIVREP